MGVITAANCIQQIEFGDYITSGYVNPQTVYAKLSVAGGIPGCSLPYTYGTGVLQVDSLYFEPLLLAGTTTLDLTSLTGIGGESLNFKRAREVIGFNPNTTAGYDVQIYHGASNGWAIAPPSTNPWWLRALNGSFRISDPNSTGSGNGNVTGSSSKTITLDPGANTVTIYLLIAGGSAV